MWSDGTGLHFFPQILVPQFHLETGVSERARVVSGLSAIINPAPSREQTHPTFETSAIAPLVVPEIHLLRQWGLDGTDPPTEPLPASHHPPALFPSHRLRTTSAAPASETSQHRV